MIERGNWTALRSRKRLLPTGRWRVQLKRWIERKADRRMAMIESRKRSMDMARRLSEGRALR